MANIRKVPSFNGYNGGLLYQKHVVLRKIRKALRNEIGGRVCRVVESDILDS